MNLPNKLTLFRVILVPFFVAAILLRNVLPHNWLIALCIFCVASYTDHLDGKIARERNLITDFGKFMDPLADKILVCAALICFVELGLISSVGVIVIIAREFMVTSLRLVAAAKGNVIAANIWGKVKTVSQLVAIILILLFSWLTQLCQMGVQWGFLTAQTTVEQFYPVFGRCLIAITVFFTVVSGMIYLKQNWNAVKETK